jgi:hypothetical protein
VAHVDEDALVAELREAETRFAPEGVPGRVDACRAQLAQWRSREPDVEHRCTGGSESTRLVFAAVCLRYGVIPYARARGRVMYVQVPRGFFREVLTPLAEELAIIVDTALAETTRRTLEKWSGVSFDELLRDSGSAG